MTMLLVATAGNFQLIDTVSQKLIRHEGLTVAPKTDFLDLFIDRIDVISELSDEATDAEWLKYVAESEGDLDLARDSFLSSYGVGAQKSPKSAKSNKKAAADKAATDKAAADQAAADKPADEAAAADPNTGNSQ